MHRNENNIFFGSNSQPLLRVQRLSHCAAIINFTLNCSLKITFYFIFSTVIQIITAEDEQTEYIDDLQDSDTSES